MGEPVEVPEPLVDLHRADRVDRLVTAAERHKCPVEAEIGLCQSVLGLRPLRLRNRPAVPLDGLGRAPLMLQYQAVPGEEPDPLRPRCLVLDALEHADRASQAA